MAPALASKKESAESVTRDAAYSALLLRDSICTELPRVTEN